MRLVRFACRAVNDVVDAQIQIQMATLALQQFNDWLLAGDMF
jgi:hypothetical protein